MVHIEVNPTTHEMMLDIQKKMKKQDNIDAQAAGFSGAQFVSYDMLLQRCMKLWVHINEGVN